MMNMTFTYSIILLILLFLPFIMFFVFKKIFQNKEIFLKNSIDQLVLEKAILQQALSEKDKISQQIEIDHLKTVKLNLELTEKTEHVEKENEALRNLLEELQKKKPDKNVDIIIEHIFKP